MHILHHQKKKGKPYTSLQMMTAIWFLLQRVALVIIDKVMYIEQFSALLMMRKHTMNAEARPSPFIPKC